MEHLQNNTSKKLINENDFNCLNSQKAKHCQKFSRGHIIHQYMSSVGVITERYVQHENLLFCEPEHILDQSSLISDVKPCKSSTDHEEDEDNDSNTIVSINCPCYEQALIKEYKKQGYLKNMFSRILNLTWR